MKLNIIYHTKMKEKVQEDLNNILAASGISFSSLLQQTTNGQYVTSKNSKDMFVLHLFKITPNEILLDL